ncbi:unnamed protein product [Lactuca virosa]|uniref:Uncharacterized protein n=1 Tax=Lactuca virosa TaxID=75947 RepID=A0AAU9M7J3_9ASTR|nr:unnamed protein product [Lactuca virosa]
MWSQNRLYFQLSLISAIHQLDRLPSHHVKFGTFSETEGVQTSSTQTVVVAEEHVVPSRPNLSSSFEVSDDDDDDDDVDDDDDDESDSNDDSMDFHMFVPSNEPVNEVVISPAETEKEINIFKQQNDPTPEQMEALIDKLQSTAKKPPQVVSITSESPSGSDKDNSKASMLPRKRKRRDPRSGILSTEPVQQPSQIVEPAQVTHDVQSPIIEPAQVIQDVQSPIIEPAQVHQDVQSQMANEETIASGSSSAPPPPEHDVVSVKLAKLLAFQDSISQSKGKGISIGSRQGGDEDSHQTISELKQEIMFLKQESIEKDLLIGSPNRRVSNLE